MESALEWSGIPLESVSIGTLSNAKSLCIVATVSFLRGCLSSWHTRKKGASVKRRGFSNFSVSIETPVNAEVLCSVATVRRIDQVIDYCSSSPGTLLTWSACGTVVCDCLVVACCVSARYCKTSIHSHSDCSTS